MADPSHVEWINAIKAMVKGLGAYCTKFHLGQPHWKDGGISVSEFLGAGNYISTSIIRMLLG